MGTITELIPKYLQIINSETDNTEKYKWEAIQHFKSHWNGDCLDEDFYDMFRESLKLKHNLIYQNSYGFLEKISQHFPDKAKTLFNHLFDDSVSLNERIVNHQTSSSKLLIELKNLLGNSKLNHQQDERTIAFLLTLHKPDEYYLYKENVYKSLCKFLIVPSKNNAGEKYFHFQELSDPILSEIRQNDLIQKISKTFIPIDFPFDSTKLLLQDILYRVLIVDSNEEKLKELMLRISEDVKSELEEKNHPLAGHKWYNNDAKKYRQVSIFPDQEISYMHYEIMMYTNDISWEFHPEGLLDYKNLLIPFINGYDSKKYKRISWGNGLKPNERKKNTFFKIKPSKTIKLFKKEIDYESMVELLTDQFIELYNDTNDRLIEFLKNNSSTSFGVDFEKTNMNKTPLNQILYGPPGTGKTYSTIDKVVEICDSNYIEGNHKHNKEIYERLVKEGRVVFTTFHQSMSYEDFIEGIKPVKPGDDDKFLKYDVEPGIFKQIANTAKSLKTIQKHVVDWNKTTYYKMSIGGKNRPDIHNWCIENNVVGLSWGGDEDLSGLISFAQSDNWIQYRDTFKQEFQNTAEKNRYNIQASYIFNKMKIGDVVVISKGNHIIDAIGKITGDYYFDDQTPTDMFHFRKVEWIATDLDASPEKFIVKQISQQSIYEFYTEDVKRETFISLTNTTEEDKKPYVLIIDEINRGNVSSIFGELMTLIEEDKRIDAPNELKVTLPYSKEKFGVPSNLYIIGTMNTADRSVESLDTALRRRFSFTEMLPDSTKLGETKDGIKLNELLDSLNARVEVLVDRDHTIGHAFFINDKNLDDLRNTFANKIIPLLQEYFYGNYEKMALVIGESFFTIKEVKNIKFASKSDNYDFSERLFHLKNCSNKESIGDEIFKNAIQTIISGVE